MATKPNFLIVGAPKCGTTAMHAYLDQHPDVYLPRMKEPHYFATDFKDRGYIRETSAYHALFDAVDGQSRIGEASVWYLYSEVAAAKIASELSSPKIIVMLRNPVDVLHSLHSQCLYSAHEIIEDFEEALAAEADRRNGRRWPAHNEFDSKLLYSATVDFAPQVERYHKAFGRDAVHVIIFDDFCRDLPQVFRECLEFLEIDPEFQPSFDVVNPNKKVRSRALQRLIRRPSPTLRRITRLLSPAPVRRAAIRAASRMNKYDEPREPMSPALRRQLALRFRPHVERLSDLLDRDLSHWCDAASPPVRRRAA